MFFLITHYSLSIFITVKLMPYTSLVLFLKLRIRQWCNFVQLFGLADWESCGEVNRQALGVSPCLFDLCALVSSCDCETGTLWLTWLLVISVVVLKMHLQSPSIKILPFHWPCKYFQIAGTCSCCFVFIFSVSEQENNSLWGVFLGTLLHWEDNIALIQFQLINSECTFSSWMKELLEKEQHNNNWRDNCTFTVLVRP